MVEKERSYEGGFSVIEITAVLAVLVLIGSTIWQSDVKTKDREMRLAYKAPSTTGTPGEKKDGSSDADMNQEFADITSSKAVNGSSIGPAVVQQLLGSYVTMKNQGTYTPENGAALGSVIAPMIHADISYQKFTSSGISMSADNSEKASLAYQESLHTALAPLRTNTTPEFEFFGMYLQTKDPQYLAGLKDVAALYQSAAANAARISVPTDVVQYHVAILNSLEEFAAVLDALNVHANDPIESTVLLRNYNNSEQDVLTAFNALRSYYANKYAKNS